MSHINSNTPTNTAKGTHPTPNSSSHETISGGESLTEALTHTLDQYELYADYAALASAASQTLGPIYNAALSQYEEKTAHIAKLYSLAEQHLARITACEKYLVTVMLVGICDPGERRILFDEFERGKACWDDLMDWLEDLRLLIRDGEAGLGRGRARLEGWMEQLDEWEEQRRGAVWEGEGFLDEAWGLWEERNAWLVQNGFAPVEGGSEAFGA